MEAMYPYLSLISSHAIGQQNARAAVELIIGAFENNADERAKVLSEQVCGQV